MKTQEVLDVLADLQSLINWAFANERFATELQETVGRMKELAARLPDE